MDNNNDHQAGRNTVGTSTNDALPKSEIEITPDGGPVTYSLPSLYYRYAEHIGKRGFSNGLLRIPQETFEKYIEAYEENKRLGVAISMMEVEAQVKGQKIRQTEELRDQLQATIIRQKQESEQQEKTQSQFRQTLNEIRDRLNTLQEKFRDMPPAYGWIGTILFIAAGVIFIITDINIIRTIARSALNMDPDEIFIFALGVAFLAIILKPLVDRVFEKPYQEGRRGWMHGLLIIVGVSTVLMLGLMGAYRNDVRNALKERTTLKVKKAEIEEEIGLGNQTSKDQEYEEVKRQLEVAENKLSSGKVTWIFILSSVLFAVGGAICFSIGVPALRQHTNREIERLRLRWQYRKHNKRLAVAERNFQEAENAWKIAEQKLPLLPNLIILEGELRRLKQDIQVARMAQHQFHTEAVLAIYRDNYQRGERYIPSEEELEVFEAMLAEQNGVQSRNYQLNRQFSGSNLFNSQYLHEYIRQHIHKENKQKSSHNGNVYHANGHRN